MANPSAYIASINAAVSPFPFAGAMSTYENRLLDGLRTVVASDLSMSVATATGTAASATHTGAAGRARVLPTGLVGAAVAVAAGVMGLALI